MAVATEVSSTYATGPGVKFNLAQGVSRAIDSNLVITNGAITADGDSTAIDVEGGSIAEYVVIFTAVSGTSPTCSINLKCSIDGGSNYYTLMILPTLDDGDEYSTTSDPREGVLARLVYIPRGNSSNKLVKVKETFDVGGTTPSFTLKTFLSPLGYGADIGLEFLT